MSLSRSGIYFFMVKDKAKDRTVVYVVVYVGQLMVSDHDLVLYQRSYRCVAGL